MGQRESLKAREKWTGLLEAFEQQNESVSRFCKRHDVSSASFYQWRRRLKNESNSGFVPVMIEPTTVDESRDGVVRLCFPSRVCVEIPASQTDLVCQAIHALTHSSSAEA